MKWHPVRSITQKLLFQAGAQSASRCNIWFRTLEQSSSYMLPCNLEILQGKHENEDWNSRFRCMYSNTSCHDPDFPGAPLTISHPRKGLRFHIHTEICQAVCCNMFQHPALKPDRIAVLQTRCCLRSSASPASPAARDCIVKITFQTWVAHQSIYKGTGTFTMTSTRTSSCQGSLIRLGSKKQMKITNIYKCVLRWVGMLAGCWAKLQTVAAATVATLSLFSTKLSPHVLNSVGAMRASMGYQRRRLPMVARLQRSFSHLADQSTHSS